MSGSESIKCHRRLVPELPPHVINRVRATLEKMLAGRFNRFDIFKGPIRDNRGNLILADGVSLEQVDLVQFKERNPRAKTGIYWLAEGITSALATLG